MSHHEKLKRMIGERRIEEAKKAFIADKKILGIIAMNDLACGFKEGAKWMQEEFLKGLWHQTDEEPEGYDEWILLHYNVGNYYSLAQVKDFKSWKGFVERAPIKKWLYIDDLFPKEGGEQ